MTHKVRGQGPDGKRKHINSNLSVFFRSTYWIWNVYGGGIQSMQWWRSWWLLVVLVARMVDQITCTAEDDGWDGVDERCLQAWMILDCSSQRMQQLFLQSWKKVFTAATMNTNTHPSRLSPCDSPPPRILSYSICNVVSSSIYFINIHTAMCYSRLVLNEIWI